MLEELDGLLLKEIPRPRVIRKHIAANCRERDVLTRLLRVSEYAAERLTTGDASEATECEVSHAE